jgi:hypothetical protein
MKLLKFIKCFIFLLILSISDKINIHIKGSGDYPNLCKKVEKENDTFSKCSKTKKISNQIRKPNSILPQCFKLKNGKIHVFLYDLLPNQIYVDIEEYNLVCSKFYTKDELENYFDQDKTTPLLLELAAINAKFFNNVNDSNYNFEVLPKFADFVERNLIPIDALSNLREDITVRYNLATVLLTAIDIQVEGYKKLSDLYNRVYSFGRTRCSTDSNKNYKKNDLNYIFAFFYYFESQRFKTDEDRLFIDAGKCIINALQINKSDIFKDENNVISNLQHPIKVKRKLLKKLI